MSTIVQRAASGCNGPANVTFGVNTTVGNLLVCIVSQASNSPAAGPQPGWSTLIGPQVVNGSGDRIGMYYRVVATPATAYQLGASSICVGIAWEIANATVTGATTVSQSNAAPATPQVVGSLGVLAAGQVALMGIARSVQGGTVTQAPGANWTFRNGNWHVSCTSRPRHFAADAVGPVASLSAQANVDANVFGASKTWGGVAVKLVNTAPTGRIFIPGFLG